MLHREGKFWLVSTCGVTLKPEGHTAARAWADAAAGCWSASSLAMVVAVPVCQIDIKISISRISNLVSQNLNPAKTKTNKHRGTDNQSK